MKKHSRAIDFALVVTLFALVAVPSFGAISIPTLGAATPFPVIDTTTANAAAKADVQAVYNQLLGMGCTKDMTGQDMNNQRLVAGSYCFTTPTVLNGQLLLDAVGNPNAVFVFKINSRFDMWPNSTVLLQGGARAENVFWVVGGATIIGSNSQFVGTVVSLNSITVGGGASASVFDDRGIVNGRLWSFSGTVSVPARTPIGLISFYQPAPQPSYQQTQFTPQQPAQVGYLSVSAVDRSVVGATSNFALFVNGLRVENGRQYAFQPGSYIVSEVNLSTMDYGAPSFSGGCSQNGLVGLVTLYAGEQKSCVIINTPAGHGSIEGEVWLPGMPNTGSGPTSSGSSYLPIFNMIGLALVAGFVWFDRSTIR